MPVAPEPYLSAFLRVMDRAVLSCRSGNWSAAYSNQQTADLMDAIQCIPALILNWETCEIDWFREFLERYDRKWCPNGEESLTGLFDDVVAGRPPVW